ncbi:MAG TPA: nuclear transport factor 2 family protein [Steroidobacteraceae bacterium]
MLRLRSFLLAAVLLWAFAPPGRSSPLPSSCASTPAAADSAKRAILQLIATMQDAWNRGDFRGYMQGFANPGVIFVSGGRFQQGWQGTLEHYIRDYGASPDTRGTLRFHDIRIEMLACDAAQLISQFELVRPLHPQYGINTRLMRKVQGRWVIALNHVSAADTPVVQATPPLH